MLWWLVGWLATATHLVATFMQSRSMPGRMKEKDTGELFCETEGGDKERDFQHSLIGIIHRHHAPYKYGYTHKLSLSLTVINTHIVSTCQEQRHRALGVNLPINHSMD